MEPGAQEPPGGYTNGEQKALLAPLFGLSAEELDGFILIAVSPPSDAVSVPSMRMRSNVDDMRLRLRMLLHAVEFDVNNSIIEYDGEGEE